MNEHVARLSVSQFWRRRIVSYAVSLLAVAAATIVSYSVPPLHATPTVLFFAAIVGAACLGKGPALLAIILSTVTVDFFLVAPTFSLFADLADAVRFVAFAGVAFVVCYLQDNYHRMAIRLREANDALELRVRDRTSDLAAANQSLREEVQQRQETETALTESEGNLRIALTRIESSLKEKDALLRELHHRVKNNLQIITSLLSLQGNRIQNGACRDLFKECQHRVRAIALVHQRLCGAPNLASIDLAAYLRHLAQDLYRSYFVGTGTVTPKVVVDETVLAMDHVVPCALIVNELLCNAFKYAFPAGQSGEVCVEVHRREQKIILTVADDGVGFPLDAEHRPNGTGLQIVQALVDQLSGTLTWANGRGAAATITFAEAS